MHESNGVTIVHAARLPIAWKFRSTRVSLPSQTVECLDDDVILHILLWHIQRICSVSQPVSAPRLKGDGWGQRDEVSAPPLQRPAVSAVSSVYRRIRGYGAVTLDNGRFLASSNEAVSRGQGYGRPIRSTSIPTPDRSLFHSLFGTRGESPDCMCRL